MLPKQDTLEPPWVHAFWPQDPHVQKGNLPCPDGFAFSLRRASVELSATLKDGMMQSIWENVNFPASIYLFIYLFTYLLILTSLLEYNCFTVVY